MYKKYRINSVTMTGSQYLSSKTFIKSKYIVCHITHSFHPHVQVNFLLIFNVFQFFSMVAVNLNTELNELTTVLWI